MSTVLYTAVLRCTATYTAALQQVIHEYCTVHSSTALYSNVHSSITTIHEYSTVHNWIAIIKCTINIQHCQKHCGDLIFTYSGIRMFQDFHCFSRINGNSLLNILKQSTKSRDAVSYNSYS